MPAETDWCSCLARMAEDAGTLNEEIKILGRSFLQTHFHGTAHNFPNAHWGYLMACMAKVEHLSLCRFPNGGNQTTRMTRMLNAMYPGRAEEHAVVIQMFRHTLMHTGELRFVASQDRSTLYTWRLHWNRDTGGRSHYAVSEVDAVYHDQLLSLAAWVYPGTLFATTKAMDIIIADLAASILIAIEALACDADRNPTLRTDVVEAYRCCALQTIGVRN